MTDEKKSEADRATEAEPHNATMNRLRERLLVLGRHGAIVGEGNQNFIRATLNQILKEVEGDRIRYEASAVRLEKQAVAERAKVEACRAFRSLVFNVVDKFAVAAESDAARNAELDRLEAEAVEEEAEEEEEEEDHAGEEHSEEEPPPKPSRRRRKKM